MDIYEIRKLNLIRLIGSQKKGACAEKWGMAPAHLSQILSDRTEKNLGDDVARRIEDREGLPRGWFDHLQPSQEELNTDYKVIKHSPPRIQEASPTVKKIDTSFTDHGYITQITSESGKIHGTASDNLRIKNDSALTELLEKLVKEVAEAAAEGAIGEEEINAIRSLVGAKARKRNE